MAKLHELLPAQKTRSGSWNAMYLDTMKKFKDPGHYFEGHTRRLQMLEDAPTKAAVEAAAREDKPVITTVFETLTDALAVFAKAEDLEAHKNATKHVAVGTVMWRGKPKFVDVPIDQLLGMENRLTQIRKLWEAIPTQDATRKWHPAPDAGTGYYETDPEETTKTDKTVVAIQLAKATPEHPEQVHPINKDVTVGRFIMVRRTGTATAQQQYEALKHIDDLLVEIKAARQRANETPVIETRIGEELVELLLEPFKQNA
jgi:hypothetical protein